MKNSLASALMLLFVVPAMAPLARAADVAEVGKPAPQFSARDTKGTERKLADFKGKTVVLEWLNYGCPYVKKHYGAGNMQALQKKYAAKGVVWLSVISSSPGKQGYYAPAEIDKMNAERKGAATAILLDTDGKVGRAYEAKTTPHMFVINSQGTLVYAGAIDDQPTTDPADLPKAKNYVAQALDETLAGKPVTTSYVPSYGCGVKY